MFRVHVIGMGEVGGRLAGALERAGCEVLPVRRGSGWDEAVDPADPATRIVAVREEDLAGVLDRLPSSLRPRTVLVQNGFLEAVHGELEVGRGLIWFTSKGEFFRELCPSIFHGPQASELVDALRRGGLSVERAGGGERFLREMIVKGIWNGVVGLPLAVHGVDLASYLDDHDDELRALVAESAAAAGAAYGVELAPREALEKIRRTTTELGWVKGGAKALPWRNGAIVRFGRRHGIPTPVNDRLLAAVGYDPDAPPRK
jgi:ketopantoate reductase